MTYEKEIEVLRAIKAATGHGPPEGPALTAAIELMRAADNARYARPGEAPADYAARMERMDESERAAARAEATTEQANYHQRLYGERLSAAEAEIERLREQLSGARQGQADRDAEIERLRADSAHLFMQATQLTTKLDKLRAAAEDSLYGGSASLDALRAAIEASR